MTPLPENAERHKVTSSETSDMNGAEHPDKWEDIDRLDDQSCTRNHVGRCIVPCNKDDMRPTCVSVSLNRCSSIR